MNRGKTTNSLTSHHPERESHRVDKMSGLRKKLKEHWKGLSKKFLKKFTNKKRRQLLKRDTESKY